MLLHSRWNLPVSGIEPMSLALTGGFSSPAPPRRSLFCIHWDDHMIVILHPINVVCHVYWFAYVEPCLHPRHNLTWGWLYDPFNVLLNSVCILLRIFVSILISEIGLWFSFLIVSLSGFDIMVILVCEMSLRILYSSIFWKCLRKTAVNSSLNVC